MAFGVSAEDFITDDAGSGSVLDDLKEKLEGLVSQALPEFTDIESWCLIPQGTRVTATPPRLTSGGWEFVPDPKAEPLPAPYAASYNSRVLDVKNDGYIAAISLTVAPQLTFYTNIEPDSCLDADMVTQQVDVLAKDSVDNWFDDIQASNDPLTPQEAAEILGKSALLKTVAKSIVRDYLKPFINGEKAGVSNAGKREG